MAYKYQYLDKVEVGVCFLAVAHTQNAQRDASASSSSHVPHESATGNAGDDLVPVQQPLSPSNHTISSVFSVEAVKPV